MTFSFTGRYRLVLGLSLVLAALAGFVVWETWLDGAIHRTGVVVAAADIYRGDTLSADNLVVKDVENTDLLAEPAKGSELEGLIGGQAAEFIPAGAQLHKSYVESGDRVIVGEGQSVYCLYGHMIDMVSTTLRRGDRVVLYGNDGRANLGEYQVAFVKDSSGREVRNTESLAVDKPLNREESNYAIASIEIVCSKDDYATITDFVEASGKGLTVVQKCENGW